MIHRACIFLLLGVMYLSAIGQTGIAGNSLLPWVNTMTGTGTSNTVSAGLFGKGSEEKGQTLPAVFVPHGMNTWTPQTRNSENKCVAPYYYSDSLFLGFRNSHWLVGGCTQDYGSMTITPQFGKLRTTNTDKGSPFKHIDEISQPNYYSVVLHEEKLRAELTGKSRSAIIRLTYSDSGKAYIVVTSNSDEGEGKVEIDSNNNCIHGENPVHRIYQGKGESAGFSGHFTLYFNKPPKEYGTFSQGAWACFEVKKGEELLIKTASSFCDLEGSEKNLLKELPTWDFDKVLTETSAMWEKFLGMIEIETPNVQDKEKFYTALYHTAFLPRCISDVDGRRPRFDSGNHPGSIVESSRDYYTDFSMWDTYRALHPLLNILSPSQNGDMMQSLVEMYNEGGWLPIFPCWNSYTSAMIGDHCISALCDAYIKGVRNFDIDTAYDAMWQNAFLHPKSEKDYGDGKGRRALKSYMKYGFIPLEDPVMEAYHKGEQVSRTLEYAYDDYCLAQVAKSLGKDKDYIQLMKRSRNYLNVIDPKTGYVQGRHKNGKFVKEWNVSERCSFITEGAPCHYTWYVPHDVDGLMTAMGGKDAFLLRLDSLFSEGRYWHGNEPCHQAAYMYAMIGEPSKTQLEVRHILDTEYGTGPGGLSGNDDAGQLSAWYVFSSLGFYPVCPSTDRYYIGSPIFKSAKIHLTNGKTFEIRREGCLSPNSHIDSMTYNGSPYDKYYITHEMIISGGVFSIKFKD